MESLVKDLFKKFSDLTGYKGLQILLEGLYRHCKMPVCIALCTVNHWPPLGFFTQTFLVMLFLYFQMNIPDDCMFNKVMIYVFQDFSKIFIKKIGIKSA